MGVLAVGGERGTRSKAGWDLGVLSPSGPDSALFHPDMRGCCSGMSPQPPRGIAAPQQDQGL